MECEGRDSNHGISETAIASINSCPRKFLRTFRRVRISQQSCSRSFSARCARADAYEPLRAGGRRRARQQRQRSRKERLQRQCRRSTTLLSNFGGSLSRRPTDPKVYQEMIFQNQLQKIFHILCVISVFLLNSFGAAYGYIIPKGVKYPHFRCRSR